MRNFRVAGAATSRNEMDALARTVAIAGYSSVIRRIVHDHFEPCAVCSLPVSKRDGTRLAPIHESCRDHADAQAPSTP